MAEALFYAVLLGGIMGACYDIFRLLRLILNEKFFFDFLYCVFFAVVFYCYILIFNSGSIRIYYPAFIMLGFLLYIFTLGSVTKGLEVAAAKKIKIRLKKLKNRIKSFKKVLQLPHGIYYNIKEKSAKVIKTKIGDDKSDSAKRQRKRSK